MSCPIADSEIERFSRQMVLSGWGGREQAKLNSLTVAVEGRYISAAVYLAAAGVGELIVLDPALKLDDPVVAHISELNPGTNVKLARTAAELPASVELVLIGTYSFSADGSSGSNPLTYRGIRIELASDTDSIKLIPVSGHSNGFNFNGPKIELTLPPLLSPDLFAGAAAASAVIEAVLRPSK